MMEITKTSILTGKTSTMSLPITQEQLDLYNNTRMKIQEVFPNLDNSQREFIKTGITQEEWDNLIINSSTEGDE